ncbi:MAG: pseudouridine-5'-phosphate glycosidase [Gemmatimonadota bacterium]
MNLPKAIEIRPEVRDALQAGSAVVALESTVVAHGLPHPRNLEAAERMDAGVRREGVVPAMIGVLGGRVVVGLSPEGISVLAGDTGDVGDADVAKVSSRDLSALVASGRPGATTVAATAFVAARVGIHVMATGGIGGVHRGGETSLDISADLAEIARTPIAVVCSGAKSILDLERTLEVLETSGVPVVGYRTDEFPAFYAQGSGLRLEHQVDSAEEAARLMAAGRDLGLPGGIVFCNRAPAESALDGSEVDLLVDAAIRAAEEGGIRGKAVTPFLLEHIGREGGERVLEANLALLADNARVAARIAAAYASATAG